jgi:branched-subunit amino acid transport protein
MKTDVSTLLLILGCALVTLIPRIAPFAIVRNLKLPPAFLKWLSYIPVCLLTALIVQSVIRPADAVPSINWLNLAILVPTLVTALKTRSLLITVLAGILSAALLRWIF